MRARAFSLAAAFVVAASLVSVSGAATTKGQWLTGIDVSTRASVIQYLRSIQVDPTGVVIQRGARNYAGPSCPGQGWSCTTTAHPVVQVAAAGGKNAFRCSTASCAVVQVAAAPATLNNTASCIKTTGLSQSCTISQSSATKNNVAIVYQNAPKSSGLTQTASSTASITQKATGSPTSPNSNTACVSQNINMDGSTIAKKGSPVTVTLEAHQTVTIKQDSANGGNSASASATQAGACAAAPLAQSQTLTSTANGSGSITQNENKANNGANMTIDIEQNQSSGFFGSAHGPNSAVFAQTNTLTAIANSSAGPISQTQSSVNGGLLGTVNQDSRDQSTAEATQTETQCEDAAMTGLTSCDTNDADAGEAPPSLTQIQFGPVHKGVGEATQSGNNTDTFSVTQTSTQDNDQGAGSQQTNVVQGDCHTSGNCNIDQTTNVDGQTTTNTQSGSDLNSSINCDGSECQATVPPPPTIDSNPPDPSNSSFAEFTFSDTQEGVTFLCQIDDGAYSACSSPQDYFPLADGQHTFSVEAKDGDGNVSEPTSYTWTIDTAPSFTTEGSLLTAKNVDFAEFGYGGMRAFTGGTNPTGDGTGSITVAVDGTDVTVFKALLFWNGPTSSGDPNSNQLVNFAGTDVTGTNIGTASSNCWSGGQGPYTNSQSYEADVTSLVPGNGSYSLSDFIKSDGATVTSDINGVGLVVFYSDGDGANNQNVVLWSGNDSNVTDGTDPEGWDETLTGVPYTGAGNASLDFLVGDGQNFSGDGTDDGAISVNGTQIVPAGGIFQGASTPAGPAFALGDLWDVESFALPTDLLTTGSNTLEVTSPHVNDCLSLVAVAATTWAATQLPPVIEAPSFVPHDLGASTRQQAPAAAGLGAGGGSIRRK